MSICFLSKGNRLIIITLQIHNFNSMLEKYVIQKSKILYEWGWLTIMFTQRVLGLTWRPRRMSFFVSQKPVEISKNDSNTN